MPPIWRKPKDGRDETAMKNKNGPQHPQLLKFRGVTGITQKPMFRKAIRFILCF